MRYLEQREGADLVRGLESPVSGLCSREFLAPSLADHYAITRRMSDTERGGISTFIRLMEPHGSVVTLAITSMACMCTVHSCHPQLGLTPILDWLFASQLMTLPPALTHMQEIVKRILGAFTGQCQHAAVPLQQQPTAKGINAWRRSPSVKSWPGCKD